MPRPLDHITLMLALLGVARPASGEERPASPTASDAAAPNATDDNESGDPPAPVDIVVTGTRTAEAAQRSTLRTGVVSRTEAERRGALSVADALEGEPGLQVNPNAYGSLGSPAGVMMQGLDAERVLVLRDGERMVGDSGGVVDLSQFNVNDVERIEYVLGPTSSLYGTGALGGVVNIITGGPRAEGLSTRARAEARTLPEYIAGAAAGYRDAGYWTSGTASFRDSGGVRLFPDHPDYARPPTRRWEAAARLGLDSPDVQTQAEANYMGKASRGLQTQEVPGLGRFTVELPDDTYRAQLRMQQRYELGQASELRVASSGQLFFGESRKDRQDSPIDEVRRREQRLLSLEATATLADGPRMWVVGARLEEEAFKQTLAKTQSSDGSLTTYREAEVEPVSLPSAALYGQLAWDITPTWTLLPGLRAEAHQRFGSVLAPRLATAYRPWTDWSLRASVGRGFRAPSAKEYGFLFDHSFLGYRVAGNADLDPERSWGVSGDVTMPLSRGVRLRIGGFHNWVQNLIGVEFAGREFPGVDDFRYINVGAARTAGGDAALLFRQPGVLRSQVAYSYLFTQNDDTGTPLPSRPAHTVLSTITYEGIRDLDVTLRHRSVSSAYLTEELSTPGFAKVDLQASYGVMESLRLFGGVLNAFDVRDDAMRPGDQRPIVGRLYNLGVALSSLEGS